jgi:hypothetical protein
VHPLGGCFSVPGPGQIIEIIELGIYLKRLAGVSGLEQVVTDMKEHYASGLLQLAYAYRFLRLGVSNLELEPSAGAGKKADIGFELVGKPYLVECYIPRLMFRDSSVELYHSFDKIGKGLRNGSARVCIRLKRTIDASDRKRIESLAIKAARDLGDAPSVQVVDDAVHMTITRITPDEVESDFRREDWFQKPAREGHPDWGIKCELVSRKDLKRLREASGDVKAIPASSFLVWQAPEEKREIPLEERICSLEKKIGRKSPQVRRSDSPGRIVVVSIPEAREMSHDSVRVIRELHGRLMRKHPDMSAIIITYRGWMDIHRHKHSLFLLEGFGPYPLPAGTFEKLRDIEQADHLQDWR